MSMKVRLLAGLLAVGGFGLGWTPPAYAIGCISGGVAGAVAGHMAHHGVLGAIGGCIAGHEYHKHQQRAATQYQTDRPYQPDQNGNNR
jgi:hypothetical protein